MFKYTRIFPYLAGVKVDLLEILTLLASNCPLFADYDRRKTGVADSLETICQISTVLVR
jgi:hypothetical protein